MVRTTCRTRSQGFYRCIKIWIQTCYDSMSDKDLYVLQGGEEINYSLGRRKYKVYMAEQWEGEHGYAPKNHDHDDEYSKLGHTHDGIGDLPAHNHDSVYSKLGHNHNDAYSKLGHSHSEFSLISHNHDMTYSKLEHDHDDTYSKLGHVHDYAASDHNHDDVYSKLGHSHELIDMLPIGTVLWFGQDVTLSNKWTVCTDLIGRYPLGATNGIGNTVEAGLPNIAGTAGTIVTDSSNPSSDGALKLTDVADNTIKTSDWTKRKGQLTLDASKGTVASVSGDGTITYMSESESPYGKSSTVTPPSVNLIPYIKIA